MEKPGETRCRNVALSFAIHGRRLARSANAQAMKEPGGRWATFGPVGEDHGTDAKKMPLMRHAGRAWRRAPLLGGEPPHDFQHAPAQLRLGEPVEKPGRLGGLLRQRCANVVARSTIF